MSPHQLIRLTDAAVIGPLMMMGGDCLRHRHPYLGAFLFVSGLGAMVGGAATFVYFAAYE